MVNESILDHKISLQSLKNNFKAYVALELTVLAITLFTIVIFIGSLLSLVFIRQNFPTFERSLILVAVIIIMVLYFGIIFIIGAFHASLYGLSYDIMLSGDLYTEFSHAFSYFRRHHIKYVFLSMFLFFPMFMYQSIVAFGNEFEIKIVLIIVDFLVFLFIPMALTSLTAQGSLNKAFKESFTIFKTRKTRLITTVGIFYVFIRLILILMSYQFVTADNGNLSFYFDPIYFFILGINIFFGNAYITLLVTRIYSMFVFEKAQS